MIKFVYQNKPRGTGDAVLKCANLQTPILIFTLPITILKCLPFRVLNTEMEF